MKKSNFFKELDYIVYQDNKAQNTTVFRKFARETTTEDEKDEDKEDGLRK